MIPVSTRTISLFIILLTTILLTGCNEVEMQSQWRTKPIAMDGSRAGWPEDVQYFDKGSRMLVSIMNDENNLYIRLLTRSETTKKMFLRAGFTIWIDDTGNTEKNFGVQFPLARQSRMPGTMTDHKPRTGIQENLADSQYNLAILNGPGGNRQTMPMPKAAEMGIYAGLSMQQSHLIYELQVPLTATKDNRTIGIGFETGRIERPAGKGSSGSGGRGGGRGGGGRGGGGGGGKGGQHGGGRPEPVEIWAKVHLAEKTII
jgi:uncharacterized membrane protein YgcG